jgi:hypothetical protein
MNYWKGEFATQANGELTASENSLVVSILSAGTFFGALTAAPFGDLLGRRLGLIVSAGVVFNLGVILQTASTAQPMFIAGRFFAGYGVGLVSVLSKSIALLLLVFNYLHVQELMMWYDSPHVPERNSSEMDPRNHRRSIPARHHNRLVPRCYREQRDQRPPRLWIIPYPRRRTIPLVTSPRWRVK